jgi:hypothetical protein
LLLKWAIEPLEPHDELTKPIPVVEVEAEAVMGAVIMGEAVVVVEDVEEAQDQGVDETIKEMMLGSSQVMMAIEWKSIHRTNSHPSSGTTFPRLNKLESVMNDKPTVAVGKSPRRGLHITTHIICYHHHLMDILEAKMEGQLESVRSTQAAMIIMTQVPMMKEVIQVDRSWVEGMHRHR